MARGVSDLGRRALRIALANRDAGGRAPIAPDLTTAELVSDAYPVAYPDPSRLNAARAASSRTLARLVARGLATHVRLPALGIRGVTLTDAGVQAARSLPPIDDAYDDDDTDDW